LLLKRTGFPQEDELVLCTVTAVHFHSVFVKIDEYERTGLIHISEIAPGRIRNIRDYVVEGKKVVCKVLKIDKEKGHIDLSLRRVNEKQKRSKLNQIKQEQLAENIVEYLAKQQKKKPEELYKEITKKLFEEYDGLFAAFEDASQDKIKLDKFIDKKLADELTVIIKQRIKPREIEVGGEITIISNAPNGVEVVKDILKKAESVEGKPLIKYKGAGIYTISIKSDDYKKAEKVLKEATENAAEEAKKQKAVFEFKKIEKD
jgi:translation initiation factor 2 subunit 1